VFAVDDCSAQLTWAASPAEGLKIEVGDVVVHPEPSPPAELVLDSGGVMAGVAGPDGRSAFDRWAGGYLSGRRPLDPAWPGGPGAVVIDGLAPGTSYDIVASAAGAPPFRAGRLRTLTPPGGRLLCKFATVSDVHIGEMAFGVLMRIHDPKERPARATGPVHRGNVRGVNDDDGSSGAPPGGAYPVRALQASIEEAAAWGAELLVAKGDLTNTTSPAQVRDVGRLLAASPVPVEAILGNHDNNYGVDVRAILERLGITVPWQPRALDLPGLRLVLMSTASGNPRLHRGELSLEMSRKIAALVSEAPGPAAWVGMHHPYERYPFRTVYPPGLPFTEGRQFLEALVGAERPTFVTFGHRHRNRRYSYGPLVITEVGSTKDYPGVWAGYKVYEAGLIQVVRRTSRPDVISWTEATRRAVNGQWRRWSPGRLDARCFTVDWPRAVPAQQADPWA
jgi:3',5'-cyclic-AMP phosphodiesterase